MDKKTQRWLAKCSENFVNESAHYDDYQMAEDAFESAYELLAPKDISTAPDDGRQLLLHGWFRCFDLEEQEQQEGVHIKQKISCQGYWCKKEMNWVTFSCENMKVTHWSELMFDSSVL